MSEKFSVNSIKKAIKDPTCDNIEILKEIAQAVLDDKLIEPNICITAEQFKRLLTYWSDTNRSGSFRYLIYDIMGFKPSDYQWLYETGLFAFNNNYKIVKED